MKEYNNRDRFYACKFTVPTIRGGLPGVVASGALPSQSVCEPTGHKEYIYRCIPGMLLAVGQFVLVSNSNGVCVAQLVGERHPSDPSSITGWIIGRADLECYGSFLRSLSSVNAQKRRLSNWVESLPQDVLYDMVAMSNPSFARLWEDVQQISGRDI